MLAAVGIVVLVLALVVGGAAWFLVDRYAGNIDRVAGVFDDLDRRRPTGPGLTRHAAPARTPSPSSSSARTPVRRRRTARTRAARSDAIMIARFSGDRQHAQLISIPRDSWVDIPGHGMNKINASYAFGGPSLLIQTVEQLTDVRIDHYVAIDFDGIIQVTDDLGGVDVVVAETTSNGPYTFEKGVNHLDGDQARWYLGQRYGLEGGDFDRVKRQQQYLRAMFGKLFSANTFKDVGKLDSALRAVTSAVSVDDTLSNTAPAEAGVLDARGDAGRRPVLHRADRGHRHGGPGERRLPQRRARRAHVAVPAHRLALGERRRSSASRRCPTSPADRSAGPAVLGRPSGRLRRQVERVGVRRPAQRPGGRQDQARRDAGEHGEQERDGGERLAGLLEEGGAGRPAARAAEGAGDHDDSADSPTAATA